MAKCVRLIGFCHFEFEGDALYLHREDFVRCLIKNAVWLDVDAQSFRKFNDKYVLVEAVFDAKLKGHMGLFSGELKDVKRLQQWPSRKELQKLHPHLKQ